jgi:hypothetical protein
MTRRLKKYKNISDILNQEERGEVNDIVMGEIYENRVVGTFELGRRNIIIHSKLFCPLDFPVRN